MKKSLRYITLLLAAIFLIAGTAMVAYADEGVGDDGGEIVGDDGGEIVSPDIDTGVDYGEDTGSDDAGVIDDGSGGGYSGDSGYSGNDSGNYDSGNTYDSGNNSGNYDSGNTYDSGNNSYDSGSNQTYVDDDPIYYGDASNYDYNASSDNNREAGSVDTKLYDAKVNKSDSIKAQKWENIEIPGANDNVKLNSGKSNGDVSFASMKANDSAGDDMGYIPYIGMALCALAVLGILYFIVATVSQKKAMKRQPAAAYAGGYSGSSASSGSEAKKTSGSGRSRNHYADDFEEGYSATRKGARADTGEINLPRRFK